MENNTTFAKQLEKNRHSLDLNMKEMASKLGINYSTYVSWETAGKEPKYDTLLEIADKLNTTPNDLLGYQGKSINQIKKLNGFLKKYDYKIYPFGSEKVNGHELIMLERISDGNDPDNSPEHIMLSTQILTSEIQRIVIAANELKNL